jgi:hypothetical protein
MSAKIFSTLKDALKKSGAIPWWRLRFGGRRILINSSILSAECCDIIEEGLPNSQQNNPVLE